MAALLAGVMLLQQPVSGWCAQNTELTQKSEARQESESSEDTADGSEEDTETTGTAAADDGENSQEEDSEDVPTLQAETDEVTLDTGTSDNAPEGQRKILDHIYAESVDLSGMTQEEAQEALQTRVDEITGYQIVLHMDDMSTGVTAKELGVPYILAKSNNDEAAKILSKIGADKVIYPEKDAGINVAKKLLCSNFLEFFEISDNINVACLLYTSPSPRDA